MAALDAVDAELASKQKHVFVSYDYLDRLGLLESTTRSTRQRLVRALVALWLSNSTRLRQLRGKIFLRPDLFDEAEKSFPDASKLRPRSVSLDWDVESLYRLLARHLANGGPSPDVCQAWLELLRRARRRHDDRPIHARRRRCACAVSYLPSKLFACRKRFCGLCLDGERL